MPKVSVIIPVYGVEKYIERCARSLFEQTLDDIEFIFVNDCTPDNSINVLEATLTKYAKRRPQVRIINFKQNQGAAKAREIGIKAATGEFVIHCDSDDWVDCHIYEKLYNNAIQNNSDIVICDMYESNGNTRTPYPQTVKPQKDSYLADLLSRATTCSLCNKLIARKIVQNPAIISPTGHMLEDQLLCVQYVYLASTFSYLREPLYYYFVNSQSVCHHPSEESCKKRAQESLVNINSLLFFLEKHRMTMKYKNEIVRMKYTPRVFLWQFVLEKPHQYISIWKNIYPEINCQYLFTKGVPFSLKLIFLLTLLRIYPYIHKILKQQ